MNRRFFLASAAAVAAWPLAAHADLIPLAEISKYLNDMTTAEARFTQFNADGSKSGGTLYIHRPGRIRFDYDPPNEALVLASAGTVAIFDGKSNSGPQQFPLRKTPLNLILERRVDLENARMLADHRETDMGNTLVVAQDPNQPELGNIELYFTDNPLTLRQWVVTDETGARTGVALGPLTQGKRYPGVFFNIRVEQEKRGG